MFKRLLKAIQNRREWNRTKKFMRGCAYSRMITGLYASGALVGAGLKPAHTKSKEI